jgi:hypothetical protein
MTARRGWPRATPRGVGGMRPRQLVSPRGCGLFHVVAGKIAFQRGWDKLSFIRARGLPWPERP